MNCDVCELDYGFVAVASVDSVSLGQQQERIFRTPDILSFCKAW